MLDTNTSVYGLLFLGINAWFFTSVFNIGLFLVSIHKRHFPLFKRISFGLLWLSFLGLIIVSGFMITKLTVYESLINNILLVFNYFFLVWLFIITINKYKLHVANECKLKESFLIFKGDSPIFTKNFFVLISILSFIVIIGYCLIYKKFVLASSLIFILIFMHIRKIYQYKNPNQSVSLYIKEWFKENFILRKYESMLFGLYLIGLIIGWLVLPSYLTYKLIWTIVYSYLIIDLTWKTVKFIWCKEIFLYSFADMLMLGILTGYYLKLL